MQLLAPVVPLRSQASAALERGLSSSTTRHLHNSQPHKMVLPTAVGSSPKLFVRSHRRQGLFWWAPLAQRLCHVCKEVAAENSHAAGTTTDTAGVVGFTIAASSYTRPQAISHNAWGRCAEPQAPRRFW